MKYRLIIIRLFIIGISITANTYANNTPTRLVDSLKHELNNTEVDSLKVKLYIKLVFADMKNELEYLDKGLKISKEIGWDYGIAKCYQNLGAHYLERREVDTALEYFHTALKYTEAQPYTRCRLFSTLAGIHLAESDLELAVDYANRALAITKEHNVLDAKAHAYFMQARIASAQKYYAKSEKYYLEVLEILDKENKTYSDPTEYKSEILFSLGANAQDIHKSLSYYRELYDIWVQKNQNHHYFGLANICLAEKYIAIAKNDSLKNQVGWNKSNRSIAIEADSYINKAKTVFEYINDMRNLLEVYQNMTLINELLGNYKEAYTYSEKYHTLNDSIFSQESKNRLAAIEKKSEIDNLKIENQLKEEKLVMNQRIFTALVLVSLLLLILGYLYYKIQKFRKTIRLREEEQNKYNEMALALVQGQEEERQRIARDLHDGLGGLLSSIKYKLEGEHRGCIHMQKVMNSIDLAIEELRGIAYDLTPTVLAKGSLTEALKDICTNKSSGSLHIILEVDDDVDNLELTYMQQVNIYRIILELINNTRKYANATQLFVQLLCEQGKILLAVEDDGIGFKLNDEIWSKGIGLKNIQDRVSYLGGTFSLQTQPKEGTSVYIELNRLMSN